MNLHDYSANVLPGTDATNSSFSQSSICEFQILWDVNNWMSVSKLNAQVRSPGFPMENGRSLKTSFLGYH